MGKIIGSKDQWSYPSYDRFVLCCLYQDEQDDQESDLLKILVPRKINPQIRWTELEKELYVDALKESGRDWAKISKKVITKDFQQCRDHG